MDRVRDEQLMVGSCWMAHGGFEHSVYEQGADYDQYQLLHTLVDRL